MDHTSETDSSSAISRVQTKDETDVEGSHLEPIQPQTTTRSGQLSEAEVINVLSQRKTNLTGVSAADQTQVEELLARLFTQAGRTESGEQKFRHAGVVFKNLTVSGVGLGALLQSTITDPFLALPRLLNSLLTRSGSVSTKIPVRKIIDNFTGVVKPGEMLLVLGAPGAGCSTFLKVLANQRYGYHSVEGDVSYGGTDAEVMATLFRSDVVYNPEEDIHYATLSVRKTLAFALRATGAKKGPGKDGQSRNDYVKEFLRTITRLFFIEHTLDTKVGNEIVRGVSGGEKKRVSIAEAIITKATTMCWDNSTRGLDSSTALEYVQALRSMTNLANISTSVALYQAGESLYQLFDKVLLIHEGRCLYFGPSDNAAAYFEGLGYQRPARWTTADFLTSITDPHARRIKPGWERRIPRSTEELAAAYAKSEINQANLEDVTDFEQQLGNEDAAYQSGSTKPAKSKNFTLSFPAQVALVTQRQFRILWGDKPTLFGKWGGVTFQALIFGSLFFDLPKTSQGVFTRGGILFFLLLFNTFLSLSDLNQAFASRDILQKHKSFHFFRPSAFAVAQIVADIPQVFVQTLIFAVITYFMADLARTASQWFIALLFLWTTTILMISFFRAIGSLTKSLDTATAFTGLCLVSIVVYTGYLIPPTKQRPWLKWIHYINPIAYSFEALLSNEFYNLQIECVGPNVVPRGPNVSPGHQSCTIAGSQPGSLVVDGAQYIFLSYGYTRDHLWRNWGILVGFWSFFALLTALGMELQRPIGGGRNTTIFKRGQAPTSIAKAIERGTAPSDEEKATVGDGEKVQEYSSSPSAEAAPEGIATNTKVFTYTGVNFTIPVKGGHRQLLQDIQGYVRPGRLTALMGASGAGKTTLLNTLAQRQPLGFGVVTGDFRVDGKPLPRSFQRATGFAEQQDVHEPTTTVREALHFSALLRQPAEVDIEERYDYCEKIIDLLEMRNIAGATVGVPGAGLNQEQRKRLTIAVELASKPELLFFLDEPTSGLDSAAAFNIVRLLRKLADAGQAVLCTIHQPSSVLFDEFDDLLLLKRGGRTVFNGPTTLLIDYFERNGARKCPPDANPAEYMLDVIGAGDPTHATKDWADVWESSSEHQERNGEIQKLLGERSDTAGPDKNDDREYARSLSTQVYTVVKRNFAAYYRTPDYVRGKLVVSLVTGLFNGFTFYHAGNEIIDMQSRVFSSFLGIAASPPLIQQLQPKIIDLRQIYLAREANSKIYSWVAYVAAAILVELPYSLFASTIYFQCWWWPALSRGRDSQQSGYAYLLFTLFSLFYVGFGQAIAAAAPNQFLASILVPMFFVFLVSFCGILVPFAVIPHFWQSWMYHLDPFRYWLEGMLGVAVHGIPVVCAQNELARFSAPPGETCQSYTRDFIALAGGYVQTGADGLCEFCQYKNGDEFARGSNIFYVNRWRNYGIFFAYIIFNFSLVFFLSWLYVGGAKKIQIALTGGNTKRQRKVEETSAVEQA